MMNLQWWIVFSFGIIGTLIAVIAFCPQSLKTIKSRKTGGVSLLTFLIYTTANALWVIWGISHLAYYGSGKTEILLKDLIIICANIPCTMWSGLILTIKVINVYKYGEDCKKQINN